MSMHPLVGVSGAALLQRWCWLGLRVVCENDSPRIAIRGLWGDVVILYALGTMAWCFWSIFLMFSSGTLRGVVFDCAARAAAAPAA